MSLIYIFAASTTEGEPVRKIASASDWGSPSRCGANDVVFIITGTGPSNARTKAESVLGVGTAQTTRVKPDVVLVIGLCGGLTESLPEGRLVSYTTCRSTDAVKPVLSCSRSAVDSLITLLSSSGIVCVRAEGITSARIATNRAERILLAQSGAAVVDMESYSILEAAAGAGIPAAVLRIVADSVDRVLPNLNLALDHAGGLDSRKALRVALGSPIRTARLLAANKRAMQRLTKALEVVLKAPCFA